MGNALDSMERGREKGRECVRKIEIYREVEIDR
jgi:hypothetical protein